MTGERSRGRRIVHRSLPSRPTRALELVRVVLVHPATPGNIGAAARALKTMGLTDLVVVRDAPFRDHPEARMLAHGALDVLERAPRVSTLDEALEGVHWVVGTTHRRRSRFRDLALPLDEAARRVAAWSRTRRVALLFGREDRGLLDGEIARCRIVTTIPTANENPSLNLAQAVMVAAYEIFLAALPEIPEPDPDLAEAAEIEALYQRIARSLLLLEFRPLGDDPESFLRSLRRVFRDAALERRDVRTLHRICQQVEFFARKYRGPGPREADAESRWTAGSDGPNPVAGGRPGERPGS